MRKSTSQPNSSSVKKGGGAGEWSDYINLVGLLGVLVRTKQVNVCDDAMEPVKGSHDVTPWSRRATYLLTGFLIRIYL